MPQFISSNSETHDQQASNGEEYSLDPDNPGRALIFLFSDDVFKEDEDELKSTMTYLKFKVDIFSDYTKDEIETTLQEVAAEDTTKDCLVVIFSTHGRYRDADCGNACKWPCDTHTNIKELLDVGADTSIHVEKLWAPFTGDKCPALRGKPKLFFIDACRGENDDLGTEIFDSTDSADGAQITTERVENYPDFLIAHSSPLGYFSYCEPNRSSWFLKSLCEGLSKCQGQDIHTVLTRINRMVSKKEEKIGPDTANDELQVQDATNDNSESLFIVKQVPEVRYTLRKKLVLKR